MKLKSLTRAAAAAGIALVVSAGAAAAQSITYSTMGTFTGSCTGTSCSQGGFTISFNSLGSTTLVAPTNLSYGEFVTTGSPPAGSFNSGFNLEITQTNPSAGSNSFTGLVSGNITLENSGTVKITFNQQQIMLGSSIYQLDNLSYNINPPATNGGLTSIQGSVSVTPEPATLALLGTGIAGLGLFGLRRRQNVQA